MGNKKTLYDEYGILESDLNFIHEYIACNFNGAKAWLKLHPKCKIHGASTQASMTLRKPKVQRAYQKELRFHFEYMGISSDAVLNEIKSIANSDITDFLKEGDSGELELKKMEEFEQYSKVIKKITITPVTLNMGADVYVEKNRIVLEVHDKLKALELMGKSLGLFEEKDKEHQEVRVVIEHKTIRSRSDITDE